MKDLQPRMMTVKEVAEVLGVTPEAIKKHVRILFPEIIENGVQTMLNEYHVTAIKTRMIPTTQVVAASTDIEMMQKANDVMVWMSLKVKTLQSENEQLQIQLDESKKWHSVKKVKSMGFLEEIGARKIWGPLKKWSIENDYKIISIFDANYGNVKTYHSDAWKAVYGLDLYFKGE